jgi:hypothetical protein
LGKPLEITARLPSTSTQTRSSSSLIAHNEEMASFPPPAKPYTPYYSQSADPLEEHSQEPDKLEPSDESGDELLEQPYSVDIELLEEPDELGETDEFPDTVGGEIVASELDSGVGLLLSIVRRGRYQGERACLVKGT